MKKIISIIILTLMFSGVKAQSSPVKIVFDVTSTDQNTHQTTMRHVKAMASSYPNSQFEVVVYGGAIDMVLKNQSSVAEDIINFKGHENVTFKVCNGTMLRKNISENMLLPGIDVVPDGILEIVQKQSEGWGYIKESHH